jgi:hypothetical protein
VQVQQRQHFIDLRGLAAPGRQDRRGEPLTLAGVGIDALVVDPRRAHLHCPRRGEHLTGLVGAVAYHQSPAAFVALVGEPGDDRIGLGLQRLGQHPPGTLAHDVIDHRAGLAQLDAAGAVIARRRLGHYGEHGSYLPDRR